MDHAHDQQRFLKVPAWAGSDASDIQDEYHWAERHLAEIFAPLPPVLAAIAACDPLAPLDPGALAGRHKLAAVLGCSVASTFVGTGARDVFGTLCRAYLKPDACVALAQPCPSWMMDEVLAAGARYVDVGCDWNMSIRVEALARVLEDQDIAMVVLADPNPISGVRLPDEVRALAKLNQTLWVLDHTFSSWSTGAGPDGAVSIRDLSLQAGITSLPAAVMTGESNCIEGCWRVHPACAVAAPAMAMMMAMLDHTESIDRHVHDTTALHIELGERLGQLEGVHVSEPGGLALMVHSLAEVPGELARRLGDDVSATWSSDHTWHGRLRLHVKSPESATQILETLRKS